jgi:DNA sulfur modification protein DndD
MKLHRLNATNFMPYKGQVTLDFPRDDARNVMIVFGDNMRGKTSILNALRWGFYGRAMGRHSRLIPLQDIINKDAALEDDWRVEVFIQFEANGQNYDLRRTATRRSHVATPNRPEDFSVATHLSKDGVVVSGDQVEAEINQVAPQQTSRFFLFDGELLQEYEELLIEGSEQGRQIKDAIEQVLGVPSLIHGRAELGAILKSATKRQSTELAHVQGLEKAAAQTNDLSVRLDAYERDLEELQNKLNEVRLRRTKLDDELDAAATVLALKAQLDGAKSNLKIHNDAREKKRVERHAILALAWKDVIDVKLETRREQLRVKQTKLTDALKAQLRAQSKISDIEKLLSTSECPTCGQELREDRKNALGTTLGHLQVAIHSPGDETSELQDVSAQIASLSKIRGVNARDRLREIDKDAVTAEVGAQRAENDIERLTEAIAGHDTAELARKRVLHGEALKEEGRLFTDIKNVRANIDKTKEDLAVAQKAIQGLAPARSQRSTLKVSLAADLERTFSSSIETLRDRLRERVGTLANDAFKNMTTQKGYRGLEINSNYGLSIIDGSGRRVPVRSAGAEQVVALSLIDGLNRTGRAVGPVVMDTPFGRLDLKHRDNILAYLPTVTSQFILLVHSGEIRRETDLTALKSRIGVAYEIEEISPTQSKIERAIL